MIYVPFAQVREALSTYWPVLGAKLPEKALSTYNLETGGNSEAPNPEAPPSGNAEVTEEVDPLPLRGHSKKRNAAGASRPRAKKTRPTSNSASASTPRSEKTSADTSKVKLTGLTMEPTELDPLLLQKGYVPLIAPVPPGSALTALNNCRSIKEMEDVERTFMLSGDDEAFEGISAEASIDRFFARIKLAHAYLQEVDLSLFKRSFAERSTLEFELKELQDKNLDAS